MQRTCIYVFSTFSTIAVFDMVFSNCVLLIWWSEKSDGLNLMNTVVEQLIFVVRMILKKFINYSVIIWPFLSNTFQCNKIIVLVNRVFFRNKFFLDQITNIDNSNEPFLVFARICFYDFDVSSFFLSIPMIIDLLTFQSHLINS